MGSNALDCINMHAEARLQPQLYLKGLPFHLWKQALLVQVPFTALKAGRVMISLCLAFIQPRPLKFLTSTVCISLSCLSVILGLNFGLLDLPLETVCAWRQTLFHRCPLQPLVQVFSPRNLAVWKKFNTSEPDTDPAESHYKHLFRGGCWQLLICVVHALLMVSAEFVLSHSPINSVTCPLLPLSAEQSLRIK